MLGWTLQPPARNRLSVAAAGSRACVARVSGAACVASGVVCVARGVAGAAYWLLATLAAVSKSKAAAARDVLAAVGIRAVVGPDLGFRRLVEQGIDDRTRLDGGEGRFQGRVRGALRLY